MNAAFSSLPSLVSLLLVIVIANAAGFGINALARTYGRHFRIVDGSPMVGAWVTATGSLCALLFAFTVITLWNAETRAAGALDGEAQAVRAIARDVGPAQLPLVRTYLTATMSEWPTLCGGGDFSASTRAFESLMHEAKAQRSEYDDDLFRQMTSLASARAQRLRASSTAVPIELWVALIALSLAMFAILAFVFLDHPHYHAALTVVFATSIGILFWVASLLDFPFCGGTAVSMQPLLDALHFIGQP